MEFAEFVNAVRDAVDPQAADLPVSAAPDGRTWTRRALTISLTSHAGKALVSYVKVPTESLGHSSRALPFELSEQGAKRAAAFIIDCLSNPYLY